MAGFEINPMTIHIGAEIHGLDLTRPMDDACSEDLRTAIAEHLVIFFRDQDISPEDHIRLARVFGEMEPPHPIFPSLDDHAQIAILENDDKRPPEVNVWHTDVTWKKEPPLGSVLHCVACPDFGGDTLWASMYAAYDLMTAPMKTLIEGLSAVHSIERFREGSNYDSPRKPDKMAELMKRFPPVSHPVVRTHPVTGKKGLFVNWAFTTHIEGVSREESEALMAYLYELVKRPECQVRFRWRPGSIAIWDNRATQHYAVADYYPHYRRMHRITILGDVPYLKAVA